MIVLLSIFSSALTVFALPAINSSLSVDAGGMVTAENGFAPSLSGVARAELAISSGDDWGLRIAGGAAYQMASAYTAGWYRYRGFIGLNLGAGSRHDFGLFDGYLLAGGHLARYDNSFSYFWFPYLEAGASMPIASLGRFFRVDAGVSIPVQFRADCFSTGLRAVIELVFLPPRMPPRKDGE